MKVDRPEGCQGSRYAVEFIFQSRAFFLELTDYRLHQCFGHEVILSLTIFGAGANDFAMTRPTVACCTESGLFLIVTAAR